jgi:hypothetical protein
MMLVSEKQGINSVHMLEMTVKGIANMQGLYCQNRKLTNKSNTHVSV